MEERTIQEDKTIQKEKMELLEAQVNSHLAENPDEIFKEYLQKLKKRIREQKVPAELLQDELDRSYQMYLRRMELKGQSVQEPRQQEPRQQEQYTQSVREETSYEQNPQVQNREEGSVPEQNPQMQNREEGSVPEQNPQVQNMQEGSAPEQNPQYIEYRDVQPPASPVKKTVSGGEFLIGATILSILGGALILTAFVMLGMYFMNGFVKGMCLYAGAFLLLLVSELLVHKRWQKLAAVFTAISIGGLYLFTVVNYLSLHNFGMQAAVLITLLITLFAIWLSRRRESLAYRSLALIASYLCLLTVNNEITPAEVLVLAGIILIINILCIVLPLQKNGAAFRAVHMCANLLFAPTMDRRLWACGVAAEYRLVLMIGLILAMQLLLLVQMRYQSREENAGNRPDSTVHKVFYWIGVVAYSEMLGNILRFSENGAVTRYVSIAAIGVICMAAVAALCKSSAMWYPYYFLNLAALWICYTSENGWETVICLVILLAAAKLLSLWRIPALRFSEAVLTALTCIALLGSVHESAGYGYVLLAAVVLSIPFISQWQAYYEVLLVYTLGFYTAMQLGGLLQLPVFMGLLFVGILLFHHVPRFQGKDIMVYNGLALAGEIVCFLLLMNPVYRNAYLTYLCMLIFGLATIVLTFQEKYQMDFKGKHLILAGFLTYMALVFRINLPVVNSILLMLIALVCVGIGFYAKEKSVRIYGLVLSLLVCGKILLYDYRRAAILQKMILFLVVGVIALIIAGIYMILEKKSSKEQ